jgi:hypothetical protein
MTAEELARPADAYFGTIAGNLHHVLWATRIWLARWNGETPPGRNDPIKGRCCASRSTTTTAAATPSPRPERIGDCWASLSTSVVAPTRLTRPAVA